MIAVVAVFSESGGAASSEHAAADYGMRVGAASLVNSAGLGRIFDAVDSPTVVFASGTYEISCSAFVANSSVSLIGAGAGKTILKFPMGCKFDHNVFLWTSKSGVKISNLTIDMNKPTPGKLYNVLAFQAYAGNTDKIEISGVAIVNGISPVIMIGVASAGGYRYSNVNIHGNFVSLAAAAPTQNQCIALTTNDGAGEIPAAKISYNYCSNSGIQTDGALTEINGNDVSGYRFGTGLFTAFNNDVSKAPTSNRCIIMNNVFHDTPNGRDINDTAPGGIENNCYNAIIYGNIARNLGGAGYFNYGSNSIYIKNAAINNGKSGSHGVSRVLDQAGFALNYNGAHPAFMSRNVKMIDNVAYDDGAGTQAYGYAEGGGHSYNTVFEGNSFSGRIQSMVLQGDTAASEGDRGAKKRPLQ